MDKKERIIRKRIIEGVHPNERDAFVKMIMTWINEGRETSGMSALVNGKWVPAKSEPYYPMGIELIKCTFGFHELVQSQKYAHTKYCFRCGKRKQDKKFDY